VYLTDTGWEPYDLKKMKLEISSIITERWRHLHGLPYVTSKKRVCDLKTMTLDDTLKAKWLNMLMAPGSSLGGARPKASVVDKKGQLWIAKFPSRNDTKDKGAWEKVVHELALSAGSTSS
jgi:serine/threonine-protein kinase HipA